jgi:hypothetical protein
VLEIRGHFRLALAIGSPEAHAGVGTRRAERERRGLSGVETHPVDHDLPRYRALLGAAHAVLSENRVSDGR